MKHSIEKIFKRLNLLMIISLTLSILSLLFISEQYYSYKKIQNLDKQKETVIKVMSQIRDSKLLDIIEFNSNMSIIEIQLDKLTQQNKYNYILNYIFLRNAHEYNTQLEQLGFLLSDFDFRARDYLKYKTAKSDNYFYLSILGESGNTFTHMVDNMKLRNILFDSNKFNVFSRLFLFLALFLLITFIWQKTKLNRIYKDLQLLYATDSNKKDTLIYTQEVDAISMRMNRKSKISDNPSMIDQITEINNNKGMVHSFAERKLLKDNNFTAISILEIDNFSKSKRTFSQEFTQEILKKVAYTISLHELNADIIARTDYNQFTLIISRPSKGELFKDVDTIRQSISEIKVSSADKQNVTITVTGAFIIKPKNSPLEETIRKCKVLLKEAKETGSNKIALQKQI